VKAEIYYIGKCDRTSVRGRWCYSAKPDVWDCIGRRSKTHRLIVAEIETEQRLTRALVSDIESLVVCRVHQIQSLCNRQNTASRGKHRRPGMKVECRGAWPLSQETFRDEGCQTSPERQKNGRTVSKTICTRIRIPGHAREQRLGVRLG